ncbi:hypothetical protein ACP3W1_29510, partial [Salmonella enterica]|uniref:hypothetical protein n=1 Tax=Salmonella enterica TaxID=28901 RepID=UPI003CF22A0D
KPRPPGWQTMPRPPCAGAADSEIPVAWCGSFPDEPGTDDVPRGGFPPRGIIRIGNERIVYAGLGVNAFTG